MKSMVERGGGLNIEEKKKKMGEKIGNVKEIVERERESNLRREEFKDRWFGIFGIWYWMRLDTSCMSNCLIQKHLS